MANDPSGLGGVELKCVKQWMITTFSGTSRALKAKLGFEYFTDINTGLNGS
jgi:hypothetical protein